jgi:DHA1 family bicyclomycin/chloramphenicol resistance-like MFS transporter
MNKDTTYLLLIISIFISAVVETDIYLPAFPDMINYFNQTESNIQKLLTWNFIGLCISGPIYGPLSDSYGRRSPLLIALSLFGFGSLITIRSDNFDMVLIGRILQGLGSGGCFTLGTAIIFDVFQKEKATNALNRINIIVPFIMATAPLLGGYLNQNFGFRANFYAIGICVFICFTMCLLFLEETLKIELRTPFNLKKTYKNFKKVLFNFNFLKLTLVISLVFAGFLCFLSSSAVLYVVEFGLSENYYPFYQCSLLVAYLVASLYSTRMMNRFGVSGVKFIGVISIIVASLMLCYTTFFYSRDPLLLTIAMIPYGAGFIWIQTPYVTEVMELMPDIKGIAASILTSLRLLITASVVGVVAKFYDSSIIPTTIAIISISALITVIMISYEMNSRR